MALTATLLTSRVRSRLEATTDDQRLTDAEILLCINDGMASLSEERDWPWLEATTTISLVAGTTSYPLPSNATRLHLLSVGGHELDFVQYRDLLRYHNVQGAPVRYSVVGGNVIVSPEPVAAETLDVYYQRSENVLVSGSDTVLCPDRYASIATTYAALYAAIRVRDQNLIASLSKLQKDELTRTYDAVNRASVAPRILTRFDTRIGN